MYVYRGLVIRDAQVAELLGVLDKKYMYMYLKSLGGKFTPG